MQIRSQLEHHAAASELAQLDATRLGSEDRIAELVEAINAWDCATGADLGRADRYIVRSYANPAYADKTARKSGILSSVE